MQFYSYEKNPVMMGSFGVWYTTKPLADPGDKVVVATSSSRDVIKVYVDNKQPQHVLESGKTYVYNGRTMQEVEIA